MEGTVVCGRCGVRNTAGDQFCGSCGAFLEWEGASTDAPATDTPPVGGAPPTEPPPALPPIAPPPAPPVTPSAPPEWRPAEQPPSSTSIMCPKCGTPNPAERTFCQSCGTNLRAARPGGSAGAAPGGSRPAAASESGGMPFWLPIVIGIGLVAGIAFVVLTAVMRPAEVPSGATTVPSPTLRPAPSQSLAASPPEGSGAPPAQSAQLTLTGATASSVAGNRDEFSADKAIDGSLETCWQEGKADEKGEWIEVTFAPSRLDYVVIYSGYQLNHDAYLGNRRPENVLISVDGGAPVAYLLADSEQPQRLDVDDTPGATTVRIEVLSTFDAIATAYQGSPSDDMAISEIRAFGAAGG